MRRLPSTTEEKGGKRGLATIKKRGQAHSIPHHPKKTRGQLRVTSGYDLEIKEIDRKRGGAH